MAGAGELAMVLWSGVALLAGTGLALLVRQTVHDRRERRRLAEMRAQGLHQPASLHPLIDPDLCIASAACVAACPEGDVLGLVEGAGRLIHGAACIGHGRCAAECPVGAIRLVFGTAERGVDIPAVTPDFETNRTGIYIAGELGGMGLIRNAVRQGVGAVRHAVQHLAGAARQVDVAIVGAGPAGLGAALACRERGASYALLDQETFGGTVAHYPRQKLILTEPIEVPLWGKIHKAEMRKEELLALWQRVLQETGIVVRERVRCENVTGENNAFTVYTSAGELTARKVVLAIGRRGTPRRLGVPGEELAHVCYGLVDPEQYRGRRVLVVGGGDSALEAAVALAGEPDTRATLCYRGEGFFRAREKNRAAVTTLATARRLTLALQSEPVRIQPGAVIVRGPEGEQAVGADFVIAALGGEAPTGFLAQLGIRIDRWFGDAPVASASTRVHTSDRRHVAWFGYLLFAAGVCATAFLTWRGLAYYKLNSAAREASTAHALLRSSGPWGHGIGVVATAIMLTNFFYAIRKRIGWFRGVGPLGQWLTVHALVGLFTPIFIAFHAAFQNKNLVAAATYYAVGAVVLTGIIGRWIYGRIGRDSLQAEQTRVSRFKRLLRGWRMLHIVLAALMVVTILVHVGVSWLLGYRWVF